MKVYPVSDPTPWKYHHSDFASPSFLNRQSLRSAHNWQLGGILICLFTATVTLTGILWALGVLGF